MVRIRLRRTGKRHQPSYRIVVTDVESPRDGRFIENIGFYNPRDNPPTVEVDVERARYWLSVGAQPSDAVARLLRKVGALAGGETADEQPAEEQAVVEAEVAEAKEAPATEGTVEEAEEAAVAEAEPALEDEKVEQEEPEAEAE
jgi:small subunit ribosomal protein S16